MHENNSQKNRRPTLEQLFDLKKTDVTDAAFWERFDKGLRQKQLAALVRPTRTSVLKPASATIFAFLRWTVPVAAVLAIAGGVFWAERSSTSLTSSEKAARERVAYAPTIANAVRTPLAQKTPILETTSLSQIAQPSRVASVPRSIIPSLVEEPLTESEAEENLPVHQFFYGYFLYGFSTGCSGFSFERPTPLYVPVPPIPEALYLLGAPMNVETSKDLTPKAAVTPVEPTPIFAASVVLEPLTTATIAPALIPEASPIAFSKTEDLAAKISVEAPTDSWRKGEQIKTAVIADISPRMIYGEPRAAQSGPRKSHAAEDISVRTRDMEIVSARWDYTASHLSIKF